MRCETREEGRRPPPPKVPLLVPSSQGRNSCFSCGGDASAPALGKCPGCNSSLYSGDPRYRCGSSGPSPTPTKEVATPAALTTDSAERKGTPMVSGCLDYFPAALAEIAKVSKGGNDKHNPGQPMHWSRGKSNDHADCLLRHLTDRGTVDTDGLRHTAKVAWRALALLQEELEAAGAPLARGARKESK